MQCIMQPTSSVVVEYSYDTMEGPQISKCGPSDVSFRTEQSYVLETTTRAAAVDHNAMHVLTDTGTAVKGVPKVRHILLLIHGPNYLYQNKVPGIRVRGSTPPKDT